MSRDADARARRFALHLTARAVVGLVALVAFGLVLVLVRSTWTPLHTLDVSLDDHLNSFFGRHSGWTRVAKVVSTIGSPGVFEVASVLTGVLLWLRGHRRLAVFAPVTVVGAGLLSQLVKALVDRHRPVVDIVLSTPGGSSFPSGHALSSTAGLGVLVLLAWFVPLPHRRWIALLAGLGVVLVGFSRLALGVHYLSDVVGGWLLGLAWLAVLTAAFRLTVQDETLRPRPRR